MPIRVIRGQKNAFLSLDAAAAVGNIWPKAPSCASPFSPWRHGPSVGRGSFAAHSKRPNGPGVPSLSRGTSRRDCFFRRCPAPGRRVRALGKRPSINPHSASRRQLGDAPPGTIPQFLRLPFDSAQGLESLDRLGTLSLSNGLVETAVADRDRKNAGPLLAREEFLPGLDEFGLGEFAPVSQGRELPELRGQIRHRLRREDRAHAGLG